MSRLSFTPRPYGKLIQDHILDTPRCGVWAGMGMGKTVSTLNALDILELVEPGPTLVCAPLRVAQSTWPDEARKWAHLHNVEVVPIVGDAKARTRALARAYMPSASIFTINYENLPWLEDTLKRERMPWPFRRIVSDESTKLKGWRGSQQTNANGTEFVRGAGAQRSRSLARVAFTHAQRFIELTGTPSPNGLQDLWGQAWFLDQGARLGRTFKAFSQRWFRAKHQGFGTEPYDHAQAEIEDRMRDLCMSLNAADWFDLREPIKNLIRVDLPAKARALYQDMERKMFMQIDGHEIEAFNAAAKTMKCLQLANGAAYVDENAEQWAEVHDVKLQALESVIEEAAGMPVLVAYHFRSDLSRLQKAFPQGRHLDKDPQTIRDWNAGRIPVLFAHPASAGHGLSLQDGGNILVFFSLNWNLEEHLQIIERIGPTRQMQAGHDRPVFIHYLVARDTIDELVLARIETKREVQDLLLEAMKRKGYR
ncbi:DEAD/DEAH box helicase [Cupriavidus basilensis]|uniref:DEAD/DEAH box helicase n=1 Tax=Cupriavidus basilensis TaxID=68895 RepID=UPI000751A640|nr:DEAD/DEAH box helicase [Cupriavidus basilensis]